MYNESSNAQVSVDPTKCLDPKWLNTELFKLGFVVSYGEVYRIKQSVVMSEDITDILKSRASDDNFTTFIDDNADYLVLALDGRGTFHGMGVMAATTNKNAF